MNLAVIPARGGSKRIPRKNVKPFGGRPMIAWSIAAALESGKEIFGRVKDKAVEGAKAADEAVHEHPYQAIAIGVGVGVIIGYLVGRRRGGNRD